MSGEYERPAAAPGGLRLHLNENTAGCSPAVTGALAALTPEDIAFYPEYDEAGRAVADAVGVPADWLLLTNGLDEGILAAAVAAIRGVVAGDRPGRPEVIVALPAFDMYGVCANAVGARLVEVQPRGDFRLPVESILAALTTETRLVFVTSPNNPTGVRVSPDEIARVAAEVPDEALVFVDEAYHDFCGDTALPLLGSHRNIVVGRTFAKAHGLAALRAGCVVAHPDTLGPFRRIVPPYSINVCAAAGLRAALADGARLEWYLAEVRRSRELIYEFCRRQGITCWESGANFVLVRIGRRASGVVRALADRGIFVRERSRDAGCDGCVRITAGVVEHTTRCLAALEDILCGAP